MKKIIIALLIAFWSAPAFAQTDSLSFDEHDKYMYYQVGIVPSVSADTLYNRARLFLKDAYPSDQLKPDEEDKSKMTLTGDGGFMIHKKALISVQPDAKIKYNLTIEVKDGKYRYWLNNFVIIPYKRDRYANYSAVSGKGIPLEHGYRKIGQRDTDTYLEKLLTNCGWLNGKLKTYMTRVQATPVEAKPRKVTKDW